MKLIKIEPKKFHFFKTIYNPEHIFVSNENKNSNENCVKKYLEQRNNGDWIILNYKKLK